MVMAMRKEVLRGGYIQADETTVMVQRPEEKKSRNHQAYLWQFGNPGGTVVFSFHLGRGGEAAETFLAGYKGILQIDGYAGYSAGAKHWRVREISTSAISRTPPTCATVIFVLTACFLC